MSVTAGDIAGTNNLPGYSAATLPDVPDFFCQFAEGQWLAAGHSNVAVTSASLHLVVDDAEPVDRHFG